MADSTNGLLPCPFCRHHACEPIQVQGERWGSYDWVIHCSSSHCGAQARIVADGWSEQIDGTLNRHIPPDQLYTDRLVHVRRMWNRRTHLASVPDIAPVAWLSETREHQQVTLYEDQTFGTVTPLYVHPSVPDRDAERYKWIRAHSYADIAACWLVDVQEPYSPESLDTAIDAAIAAAQQEGKHG